MTLTLWYKYIALASAFFWLGLGAVTIGSISVTVSTPGWVVNLIMGLFFILIGLCLHRRASIFYRFYSTSSDDVQNNQHLLQFLRLDLVIVSGSGLFGGLLLSGALSRVFLEGFAVFG